MSSLKKKISNQDLGKIGEEKTDLAIDHFLEPSTYKKFNNLILPHESISTAQIDHLLVSVYGLFIIETKNTVGWIFGGESNKTWTQLLFNKAKHRFQNPVHQTERQKRFLADFLSLSKSKIYTVINFVGQCEFKTEMPANVIKGSSLPGYIKSFKDQVFTMNEVQDIIDIINHLRVNSSLTDEDHLFLLNQRHNSMNCPQCGSELKLKIAKKGPKSGSNFIGCDNFPKCRYARSV